MPNLRQKKKTYRQSGRFYDPGKDKFFDFDPQGGSDSDSQHGFDSLALWVVVQVFVLGGFTRLLYGDAYNMDQALLHLERAFPDLEFPQVWPLPLESERGISTGRRPAPKMEALVEPSAHHNHPYMWSARPTRFWTRRIDSASMTPALPT
ncbi:MAG: hypothetical protein V3U23_10705 [Kiloniellales bacterium]